MKALAQGAAGLPWRATALLPWATQRRIQLLLGEPPLGPSGVWSAADPIATYAQRPSLELVNLLIDAARLAASPTGIADLVERSAAAHSSFATFVDIFPGEHYRLLAALTTVLRPLRIVEIGTYTGASALAFLGQAGAETELVTYDILAWHDIPGTLLRSSDFEDGRLQQRLVDLTDVDCWTNQLPTFREADLIFMDGPKDGAFEPLMLKRLATLRDSAHFVLVVDDIRFLEMLRAWADFPSPKLDATSFGHWSGTGLALIGSPLDKKSPPDLA